jgi:hypothetical protein
MKENVGLKIFNRVLRPVAALEVPVGVSKTFFKWLSMNGERNIFQFTGKLIHITGRVPVTRRFRDPPDRFFAGGVHAVWPAKYHRCRTPLWKL